MIATAVENTKTAWLGEFPAHWEVLRIKNLFQEMDSRSETGSEETAFSVPLHWRNAETGKFRKRRRPLDQCRKFSRLQIGATRRFGN